MMIDMLQITIKFALLVAFIYIVYEPMRISLKRKENKND